MSAANRYSAGMPATLPPLRRAADERVNWVSSIPFLLVHLLCFAVIFTGFTTTAVVLFVVMYFGRAFFVTAAYHRYFSHKAYRLNRFWQFVFAFQAEATAQKGVLWWAANHRHHHRYSDQDSDLHSPRKGFWWSHVGWILSDKYKDTDYAAIKDFAAYPELRWLDKHDWIASRGPARRRSAVLDRRVGRARDRVLLVDGAPVAHHVPGELARARLRAPSLRDDRRPAGTPSSSPSSRAARGGTTTITTTRRRPARASSGGRSTPPTTGSRS